MGTCVGACTCKAETDTEGNPLMMPMPMMPDMGMPPMLPMLPMPMPEMPTMQPEDRCQLDPSAPGCMRPIPREPSLLDRFRSLLGRTPTSTIAATTTKARTSTSTVTKTPRSGFFTFWTLPSPTPPPQQPAVVTPTQGRGGIKPVPLSTFASPDISYTDSPGSDSLFSQAGKTLETLKNMLLHLLSGLTF